LDRCLSDAHLAALDAQVGEWRDQVVKPLRALRRQLRAYASAEGVRDALKSLEVQAEREQQDLIYAFYQRSPGLPCRDGPLLENLTRVGQLASPDNSDWESVIRHLAARIVQ
jgi:hypothetical protein